MVSVKDRKLKTPGILFLDFEFTIQSQLEDWLYLPKNLLLFTVFAEHK